MLRADELMVGDWVYCEGQPTPDNVIIQSIHKDGVWFQGEEFEGAASYDRIFPIPLTPEILEKNGFERGSDNLFSYGRGMYVMMWSKGHYSVGQIFGNWSAFVEFAEIRFIHELQHALRLCGIDKTIEL